MIKSRYIFIQPKIKNKHKIQLTSSSSTVPQNLQTFKKKLLSGSGFIVYEGSLKFWVVFLSSIESFENFQILDDTSKDTSIIERDYVKIYHQDGAQLNDSNQCIDFFFDEFIYYHQKGNGYLEVDITLGKIGGNFNNFDGDGKNDKSIGLV